MPLDRCYPNGDLPATNTWRRLPTIRLTLRPEGVKRTTFHQNSYQLHPYIKKPTLMQSKAPQCCSLRQRLAIPLIALLALSGTAYAQKNIVQPGDPILASSANSPGSEGVANAIDGKP